MKGTQLMNRQATELTVPELVKENYYLRISLCKMLTQFYDHKYTIKELKEMEPDIPLEKYMYTEEDGCTEDEEVDCVFHMFEGAGESAYAILGLERNIYLFEEIWDMEQNMIHPLLKMQGIKDRNELVGWLESRKAE